MGGVRTLKWEGFGHWGGRVLDIGEARVGHRGKGLEIREWRGCTLKGGGGIPVPWNVFEAPTRYI